MLCEGKTHLREMMYVATDRVVIVAFALASHKAMHGNEMHGHELK